MAPVIIAGASHEDIGPYHRGVMAYDATMLRQHAVFRVTPNGADGNIWQSSRGPAVNVAGKAFVVDDFRLTTSNNLTIKMRLGFTGPMQQ
jgi:hypothetical protein